MKIKFRKTFKNAVPFIYETPNGLYYIGYGICRICDITEMEMYKKFIDEYSKVRHLQQLTKSNTQTLIELFDQVSTNPEYEHSESEETKTAKKNLAESLSDDEIENILSQRELVLKIYDYKKGRFN